MHERWGWGLYGGEVGACKHQMTRLGLGSGSRLVGRSARGFEIVNGSSVASSYVRKNTQTRWAGRD